jgi:hypothetical protein
VDPAANAAVHASVTVIDTKGKERLLDGDDDIDVADVKNHRYLPA